MRIFNRFRAVEYANKWVLGRNPQFPNFGGNNGSGGGDCANFVSQCLYAGGMQQITGLQTDVMCWWSSQASSSWSWAAARNLKVHLDGWRRASPCERNQLRLADVVFIELGRHVLHSMIVTEVSWAGRANEVSEAFLSYHSRDVKRRPLSEIEQEYSGQQLDGHRVVLTFWKIRDLIPQPNADEWPPPRSDRR